MDKRMIISMGIVVILLAGLSLAGALNETTMILPFAVGPLIFMVLILTEKKQAIRISIGRKVRLKHKDTGKVLHVVVNDIQYHEDQKTILYSGIPVDTHELENKKIIFSVTEHRLTDYMIDMEGWRKLYKGKELSKN